TRNASIPFSWCAVLQVIIPRRISANIFQPYPEVCSRFRMRDRRQWDSDTDPHPVAIVFYVESTRQQPILLDEMRQTDCRPKFHIPRRFKKGTVLTHDARGVGVIRRGRKVGSHVMI